MLLNTALQCFFTEDSIVLYTVGLLCICKYLQAWCLAAWCSLTFQDVYLCQFCIRLARQLKLTYLVQDRTAILIYCASIQTSALSGCVSWSLNDRLYIHVTHLNLCISAMRDGHIWSQLVLCQIKCNKLIIRII